MTKYTLSILGALCVLLATSCIKDPDVNDLRSPDTTQNLSINLNLGDSDPRSRAVLDSIPAAESKIDDVWLVILADNSATPSTPVLLMKELNKKTDDDFAYSTTVEGSVVAKIGKSSKAYIVANMNENATDKDALTNVTTLQGLQDLRFKAPMSDKAVMTTNSLLYISSLCDLKLQRDSTIIITDTTPSMAEGTIKLKNLLCKLDIKRGIASEITRVVITGVNKTTGLFGTETDPLIIDDSENKTGIGGAGAYRGYYYVYPTNRIEVSLEEAGGGYTPKPIGIDSPKTGVRYMITAGGGASFIESSEGVSINGLRFETPNNKEQTITFVVPDNQTVSVKNASDTWIKIEKKTTATTRSSVVVDKNEMVNIVLSENTSIPRNGIIVFEKAGKTVEITVRQQSINSNDKYYVVLVAGQSNASGVDRSAFTPAYDSIHPRVFQFGQKNLSPPFGNKYTKETSLDIIPLEYLAQSFETHVIDHRKSMHLSLGKQILPHIPADYKILVVSATYSGAGFVMPEGIGTYDSINMRDARHPSRGPSRYKMEANNGVMFNGMVDRTIYALSLNKQNKFLGVVWSQGEVDSNNGGSIPELAYQLFEEYAEAFFNKINARVSPEQLPNGYTGKHAWFAIDCVPIRTDWHRNVNPWQYATGQLFGGYKVWHPDTYVVVPPSTKMNEARWNDDGHFGQNAFPETVVPLIIERMKKNGVLGNTAPEAQTRFLRSISLAEATDLSGNLNDIDIQNGLMAHLPFNDEVDPAKNTVTGAALATNHGMTLTDVTDLKDISGNFRARKALKLNGTGQHISIDIPVDSAMNSWSASFMLKRQNSQGDLSDAHLLRSPNTTIGLYYHKYHIDSEGRYLGLAYQPAMTTFDRFHSVVARLRDASFVRSHEEWIHYSVSYNHTSRLCNMYMNGELTMSKTLAAGAPNPNIVTLHLGDASKGIDGYLYDLYIWNREVPASTLFKTYIMSYYDVIK